MKKKLSKVLLALALVLSTSLPTYAEGYKTLQEGATFNNYISENQDYSYLNKFYDTYGTQKARTNDKVISNMKAGKLPLSVTNLEAPVDTKTTVKETRSSVDTTYVDTYSDGSIMVRGTSVYGCTSGSGYSNCSVKYTASNGTLDAMSRAKFSRIQGKNNDQVTSAYDGFVGSHVYGLKASNLKPSVCRKNETSSKPASAQMKFTTKIGSLTNNNNYIRFRVNDGKTSVYHRMHGDSGSLAAC